MQTTLSTRRVSCLGRVRIGRQAPRAQHVCACAELAKDAKVKVTTDITVYHVPGNKQGLELKGMEGAVNCDATEFNGVTLSLNYPWKIQFETEVKGKPKKFFVHMREDEVETV